MEGLWWIRIKTLGGKLLHVKAKSCVAENFASKRLLRRCLILGRVCVCVVLGELLCVRLIMCLCCFFTVVLLYKLSGSNTLNTAPELLWY